MNKINFLKCIELCFKTVMLWCEYNDYQYIKVIADRLEAASASKVRQIIFNMPPRSMKSMCISVAWPAWILRNQPTARIIVASYSQRLSEKHSLGTVMAGEEAIWMTLKRIYSGSTGKLDA
ncbi:MAG: hypothetical protein LKM43_00350 [Wolbachia endosymbiont of Penenirmus auritus]|nr:hypothetical protein [Wolbachia endosymbiont of Penenirmus auritus]